MGNLMWHLTASAAGQLECWLTRGNPDVRATGNGARWCAGKSQRHSLKCAHSHRSSKKLITIIRRKSMFLEPSSWPQPWRELTWFTWWTWWTKAQVAGGLNVNHHLAKPTDLRCESACFHIHHHHLLLLLGQKSRYSFYCAMEGGRWGCAVMIKNCPYWDSIPVSISTQRQARQC